MATATPLQMQDAVSQFLATPRKLLIDGKWVAASSGKTFDSIDPSTGEVLARVAEGDLRTVAGQSRDDRLADAAAAAGHERDFILERHVRSPLG